ncbi:MAG: hypothetical protein Q8L65_12050 [Burkholderiales bacterium]|nr:hypothetical protein [Burkholderiales bacterium]MDP2397404.1 hypothetical protein [Burkholderiales bacterium]
MQPTVASRLERRLALISSDEVLGETLRAACPAHWQLLQTADIAALGGFADILQYRFLLLDLDDAAFDPLDVIDTLRRELMLNIAIVCVGGDAPLRDAARLARADRFFGRDEATEVMLRFCVQYDW